MRSDSADLEVDFLNYHPNQPHEVPADIPQEPNPSADAPVEEQQEEEPLVDTPIEEPPHPANIPGGDAEEPSTGTATHTNGKQSVKLVSI